MLTFCSFPQDLLALMELGVSIRRGPENEPYIVHYNPYYRTSQKEPPIYACSCNITTLLLFGVHTRPADCLETPTEAGPYHAADGHHYAFALVWSLASFC